MKALSLIFISLLLISCGATVAVDYDNETDFQKFTSYNYFPDLDSGLSELDNGRIMQITDSLLQGRGFIKSGTPNFLINFFAQESVSNSRNTIGIGIGGGGGNVGVGVGGGIPIGGRVVNQQLTMDFIDAENDALFWKAVAEGERKEKASPTQKDNYYINLIQKMLKKYPPGN